VEDDLRIILENVKKLVWRRWLLAMFLVFQVGFSVPHARDVLFCATAENFQEISSDHSLEGFDVLLSSFDDVCLDCDCLDKVFCREIEGVSRSSLVRLTINNAQQQKSNDVPNLLQPIWASDLRGTAPPAFAQYFFLKSVYISSLSTPTIVFLHTVILAV
jgi:hypothetical protein